MQGWHGGEDDRANDDIAKLVKTVLFVHERSDWLDRGQKAKYCNCKILESVKGAIRAKACKAKLPWHTNNTVAEQLSSLMSSKSLNQRGIQSSVQHISWTIYQT